MPFVIVKHGLSHQSQATFEQAAERVRAAIDEQRGSRSPSRALDPSPITYGIYQLVGEVTEVPQPRPPVQIRDFREVRAEPGTPEADGDEG